MSKNPLIKVLGQKPQKFIRKSLKTKKILKVVIGAILALILFFFLGTQMGRNILKYRGETNENNYTLEVKDIDASTKTVLVWDARPEIGINLYATSHIGELDLTKAAGLRILRTSFNWATMENETTKDGNPYNALWGVYNQSYLANWQNRVILAKERGLKLSVLVAGRPEGLTYENREEGYQHYASFMGDMAKRYPDVLYWELFNEMDHPGWTPLFGAENNIPMVDRGKLYAQMLKLAYPAMKTANPNALVVTGGITTLNNAGFTDGIYQGGGKDFFDVMNIHTYGMPAESAMRVEGTRVRNVMNKYGDNGKPLWNTEYGLSAGVTVGYWGYPRTWTDPSNLGGASPLDQDPPQCRWADLPKDSTGHLLYDGDGFDYMHCKQWRLSLNYAKESRLYQKVFPYSLSALNELDASQAVLQKSDKSNDDIHDYGFGAMRNPHQLLLTRPTYEWLKAAKINQAIISEPNFTTDVLVENVSGFAPEGYSYTTSGANILIKNVIVDSELPTKINLIKQTRLPFSPSPTAKKTATPSTMPTGTTAPGPTPTSAPDPVSTSILAPETVPTESPTPFPSSTNHPESPTPSAKISISSPEVTSQAETNTPESQSQTKGNKISKQVLWGVVIVGGLALLLNLYLWIRDKRRS